ncbi:MAG: protein DnrP [Gammaproteobacteria bacterium]|nr:MAG: protein DnrP [Gammaproteobacteria bacterium]
MSNLSCKHCGRAVEEDDQTCPNCGIPLPPKHGQQRQRSFVFWFIGIVIFCFVMMFWLPPDWSPFVDK